MDYALVFLLGFLCGWIALRALQTAISRGPTPRRPEDEWKLRDLDE